MNENKRDDGGVAFPFVGTVEAHYGMTLRDWFAGQALCGLLGQTNVRDDASEFARFSYAIADAMLEERKK